MELLVVIGKEFRAGQAVFRELTRKSAESIEKIESLKRTIGYLIFDSEDIFC